jgi:hypothetical protein
MTSVRRTSASSAAGGLRSNEGRTTACGRWSSHLPLIGRTCGPKVALTALLRADGSVDLSPIVMTDLLEHREEHDRPVGSTPISYPDARSGEVSVSHHSWPVTLSVATDR